MSPLKFLFLFVHERRIIGFDPARLATGTGEVFDDHAATTSLQRYSYLLFGIIFVESVPIMATR